MAEEDPKIVARDARKEPETEKLLRQFLTLESGNYVTEKYRSGYDATFGEKELLPIPEQCAECDYVAKTVAEKHHHTKMVSHDTWETKASER